MDIALVRSESGGGCKTPAVTPFFYGGKPMGCPICEHPRAQEMMGKVFAGTQNYVDAAKELNVSSETVWKCFNEHWETEEDSGKVTMRAIKEAKTTDDFVELLRRTLQRFIKRLNSAMEMPVSAYNESAVTRLSAELRAIMRDVLEFEGKLHSAPLVQLNIIQMQMTKLTSFMFSELCEEDRKKLIKILPELGEVKTA